MTRPLIDIHDLSLTLEEKPILSGVTLSVKEGEYVSIIGPNGAGKTSMLRCLGRIYSHWGGTIRLGDRDLRAYRQKDLARHLSYVPQGQHQMFPFTVIDFVTLGRYPHLSAFTRIRREDRIAVDQAIEMAGVGEFRYRQINTLSGGERQMVLIAAALAQGARVLLLDEPATSLDYRHQVDVMHLLKRINTESGLTVLSVDHDVNNAALWSDRVVAIKGGRLAFEGPPDDLMRGEVLQRIFETPFRLIDRAPVPVPLALAEGPS